MTNLPQASSSAVRHGRAGLVVAIAAVAALWLAVPSGVALAASKPPPSPGKLWNQYPLNPKEGGRDAEPAPPPAPASTSEQPGSAPQPSASGNVASDDARLAIARVLFVVALMSGGVATLLLLGFALSGRRQGHSTLHFPRPPPLRRAVAPVGRSFVHAGESLGHAAGSVGHAAGSFGHAARSLGRLVGEVAPRRGRRQLTGIGGETIEIRRTVRHDWVWTAIWYLASVLVSVGATFLVFGLLASRP
jgi:hypothetical protein